MLHVQYTAVHRWYIQDYMLHGQHQQHQDANLIYINNILIISQAVELFILSVIYAMYVNTDMLMTAHTKLISI